MPSVGSRFRATRRVSGLLTRFFLGADRGPCPLLFTQQDLGRYGEKVAAAFLRRQGYRPLIRNFSTEHGEIDIICRQGERLVFVEVKSSLGQRADRPATNVNSAKRHRMLLTAHDYLRMLHDVRPPTRFDIVEVWLEMDQIPRCALTQGVMSLEGAATP